ncbi:DAPG hydrolase family protein [Martelella alba]|uniref:Hydrolase n=1 Tax=Martelella alba TaxID=2590451 RepID=A0ABY2SFG1_9HYPH|nr:hydrolase [Martelella alba]TKI02499.1 hydrolase [Martelella alba]
MCINHSIDELDNLLNPFPLKLEMGINRTSNNLLIVAVRTDLQGCTGEMLEWWYRFFCSNEHFKWWHPCDHKLFYGWDDKWIPGKNFIDATVHFVEKLGNIAPLSTKIKYCHPENFFSARKLIEAHRKKWISTAICGYIGLGNKINLDENGNPLDGIVMHLARDTSWGCVLRSRYIFGERADENSFFSNTKNDLTSRILADDIGLNLMQHCHREYISLAHFLPSLYYSSNIENVITPAQW